MNRKKKIGLSISKKKTQTMDFPIGGLTGGMLKMNLLVNVLYVSDLSR